MKPPIKTALSASISRKFILDRDGAGIICKFPEDCSSDDFLEATIAIQEHARFDQALYCIYEMDSVNCFTKGQVDLMMILAHLKGSIQTNSRIKIVVVSNNESALALASWISAYSNRNVRYFNTIADARNWLFAPFN